MSVRGLKTVQNPLNAFQTILFRTSACRRQPSWIWKENLATALLIDIVFIMAGLAYVQHSASEKTAYSEQCLQPMRIADRRQCLGVLRSGRIFTFFFKAQ